MTQVLHELISYFFRQAFGEGEIFAAALLAFAFWCLDCAWLRRNFQPFYSGLMAVIGIAFIVILAISGTQMGQLFRVILIGSLMFIPFFQLNRRNLRSNGH